MKIPLDSPPFSVRAMRQTRPRLAQLASLGPQLRFELPAGASTRRVASPDRPGHGEADADRDHPEPTGPLDGHEDARGTRQDGHDHATPNRAA